MVDTVPRSLADWMWPFVRCFTGATWDHVLVLVAGALLSPGRRTVTAALRVMDLDQTRELCRLSSRAEHRTLVGPARGPSAAALAGRRLCPGRAGRHRSRRHDRAPLGNEDQGARHLPGPGPLQPGPLCQGERSALAVRHAARAHSLGRLRLGAAVPDHPGALRTLRAKPGPAAQEADRLGPPGAAPNRPLAARPADRRGRRQQLFRDRAAALRQPASGCGHPAAARCRPV